MSAYIIKNGELYHTGVKGMKWGVRRFQNPDGTLTPAGKKRYASAKREKDYIETRLAKAQHISKEQVRKRLDTYGTKTLRRSAFASTVSTPLISASYGILTEEAIRRGHPVVGSIIGGIGMVRTIRSASAAMTARRYARAREIVETLGNGKTKN